MPFSSIARALVFGASYAGSNPVRAAKYAACPGGEGAVLKTVGQY